MIVNFNIIKNYKKFYETHTKKNWLILLLLLLIIFKKIKKNYFIIKF